MELIANAIGKYTLTTGGSLITRDRQPSVDHEYVIRLEWSVIPEAQYYVLRRGTKEVARTTATTLYFALAAVDLAFQYRLEAYENLLACRYYQPPPTRLGQSPPLHWKAPQTEYNRQCAICLEMLKGTDPPPHPPLIVPPLPLACSAAMHEKHRAQHEREYQERYSTLDRVRTERDPLLDGADLLFCGHALHQR